MIIFEITMLTFLIICAISVSLTKKIISAIIIFLSYSIVMSIIWLVLKAPDLALTEAAVGVGITGLLFFLAIRRINQITEEKKNGK